MNSEDKKIDIDTGDAGKGTSQIAEDANTE
jgi:hypothetical protein